MIHNRLPATKTALLITLNAYLYGDEKGKAITRYKLTRKSLKNLSRRKTLQSRFVFDVANELQELGWQLIEDGDGNYCFFDREMTANWPRLSAIRIKELRDSSEKELCFQLDAYQAAEETEEE
ncbi:hypothetical protein [Xenorhabdus bovienii]|uniref:hypothetical protein n=1 Tax=Xenorhabdus bovienii TaxID=40576 RepID=UPI0023B2DE59|nr:hypothetical protein [Xenorhabdus bovienii]MDE9571363.1 hypothetical protein [Xenorhabdus bovienii]